MTNRFFIFLLGLFILSACNKDESGVATSQTTSVSVYAMVPDAPQMNFFVNGANIAASVPFGSFTLYSQVAPGTVTVKAQTISLNNLLDTTFTLSANEHYSFFLTDSFAAIRPVLIHDSLTVPDSGYMALRFFVLSPGVSGIDLRAVKDSADTHTWMNRSFSDNMENTDSINTFIKLPEGTYSFYAIKTNSTDTIGRFKSLTFSDSSNYTLMLEGFYNKTAGDTTLKLGSRLH